MHAFAFIFVMQANAPEIRSFDDAIVMLSSANQSENTTVSIQYALYVFVTHHICVLRLLTNALYNQLIKHCSFVICLRRVLAWKSD